MSIFGLSVIECITVAIGTFLAIIGIVQLIKKKCVGFNTSSYTEESAKKFAIISGVIYTVFGLLDALYPIVTKYLTAQFSGLEFLYELNIWIIIVAVILVLIFQFSVLKKK